MTLQEAEQIVESYAARAVEVRALMESDEYKRNLAALQERAKRVELAHKIVAKRRAKR